MYILHDPQKESSERVSWSMTRNLVSSAEDAWFEMFATWKDQAALKEHAGVDARGRKNSEPVLHYTLSWAQGEQPSEQHMKAMALSSLKALGLEDHQAVISGHRDKEHMHLHVVVNTVHPYTGRTADLKFTKLEFSRWAEAYEREHMIHCEQRILNNEDRRALAAVRKAERDNDREPSAFVPIRDFSPTRAMWFERRVLEHGLSAKGGDPVKGVLQSITRTESTFTRQDLARLVGALTNSAAAFTDLLAKIEADPELVRFKGTDRMSTQTMVRAEAILAATVDAMSQDQSHAISRDAKRIRNNAGSLTPGQRVALAHVTGPEAIACVTGYAGSGKSTMLKAAREVWEASGYTVRGAALSGIAAEGLEQGSGISSSTLHALQWGLANNATSLGPKDILVIDEAGMVGSRQMQQVVSAARLAGAKVVMVGDPEQLQAIEAGAAYRIVSERVDTATITEVVRQRTAWQRQATTDLASGRTSEAIEAYARNGAIRAHATKDGAAEQLVASWAKEIGRAEGKDRPGNPALILAATRMDVARLNGLARSAMKDAGKLGDERSLGAVEERIGKPTREMSLKLAVGERLLFTKNDRRMGVRNGTLGTLEAFGAGTLVVRLDGPGRRRVVVELNRYRNLAHGYAMTIHKAQGTTVERALVLAGRSMDRHMAYVALSRQRGEVQLHYGRDQFASQAALIQSLSRRRMKETTLDYMQPMMTRDVTQAIEKMSDRTAPRDRAEQIRFAMSKWREKNDGKDFGRER